MKISIKPIMISIAALATPVFATADRQIDVSVDFTYDSAQSADANYAAMQKSAKAACKVLDQRSDSLAFNVIRKAQTECVAQLVEGGVSELANPDLTLAHRTASGEHWVQTAQAAN